MVGKSGLGIKDIKSETDILGLSIKLIVAFTTSVRLCGGISVAIPTAIPDAPFNKTLGNLEDRYLGSIKVPSKFGIQSTVP